MLVAKDTNRTYVRKVSSPINTNRQTKRIKMNYTHMIVEILLHAFRVKLPTGKQLLPEFLHKGEY